MVLSDGQNNFSHMVILCSPLIRIKAIAPPPEVAGAQIVSPILIIKLA
jgi:hypothetical protein